MSNENILAFLDLRRNKKTEGVLIRNLWGMDVGFTIFIIVGGLLVRIIPFSFLNITFIIAAILSDVAFYFIKNKVINPAHEFSYTMLQLIISILKLFWGYDVFSKGEIIEYGYSKYTTTHTIIMVACIVGAICLIARSIKIYSELKKYTLDEYRIILRNKKRIPSWIIWVICAISTISPLVLVNIFEDKLNSSGFGIGCCLWSLAWIWIFNLLILTPKWLVAKKYKVAEWILEEENDLK